jgi:O-antigen biosynthesis protein
VPYTRARLLVRLHGVPIGTVDLDAPSGALRAEEYAPALWNALALEMNQHLLEDGLPPVLRFGPEGLPIDGHPVCQQRREAFLATAPFVTVVIPTHNRPEQVSACVASVLAQEYPHFEIVVVDNGPSTSETADLIAARFGDEPKVSYVCEAQAGTSRARNRGLIEARSEIIAYSDDDVQHDPQWLMELVRGFFATEHVGCVTGSILPMELDTEAQIWLEQYGGFHKGFAQRIYDLKEHRPPDPLYPYTAGTFGSGANVAYRAEALRATGGYDEALGGGSIARGGEDLAVVFDIVARGWRVVYAPTAMIYHPHFREYERLRNLLYGYGMGLTAYLTKTIVDRPLRLLDFVRAVPYGLYFALSPGSRKNAKKQTGYPAELTRIELRGMLRGPDAYLRGRLRRRRAAS